jgi:hypothetical protein
MTLKDVNPKKMAEIEQAAAELKKLSAGLQAELEKTERQIKARMKAIESVN